MPVSHLWLIRPWKKLFVSCKFYISFYFQEFVIRDDFDPLSLLGGVGASPPPRSPPIRRAQGSERAIFELQLTQLQEQLVTAMIDNQNISESFSMHHNTLP